MGPQLCVLLFILSHSQPGPVFASTNPQLNKDALLSSPQQETPQSPRQFVDSEDCAQTKNIPGDTASAHRSESRIKDLDYSEEILNERSPSLDSSKHLDANYPLDASYEKSNEDNSSLHLSTSGQTDGELSEEATGRATISETSHQELLPVFKEAMLGYYVKRAIHVPVCVLFRQYGPVSQLERQVRMLWVKVQAQNKNLYGSWRLGAFFKQSKPARGFGVQDQLPVLRCYIGTALPADYRESGKAKNLHRWLMKQVSKHKDRIPEFSSEALESVPTNIEFILIVFVDGESHYEVESQMNELREIYQDNTRVLMVQPDSDDTIRLMTQYGINTLPATVVLNTKDIVKTTVLQKFEGDKSSVEHLKTFLSVRMSPITILTLDNFESRIVGPMVRRLPTLVCFHAPWGRDTGSYLDALQRSAAEFYLEDGAGLDFGLVDLTRHAEVVTRWVDATYAKGVPFSVLFWWKAKDDKKGPVLHQKLFPDAIPTPWTVATFLEDSGVPIFNAEGEELQYSPWAGHDIDNEISYGFTSYTPNLCTTYANSSLGPADVDYDHDLCDPSSLRRPKRSEVKKKKKTETTETRKLPWIKKKPNAQSKIGTIAQVTDSTWSSIVERSQAAVDPLRLSEPWRKGVASTTLVAFIQTDCSNCRRKLPIFERLVQSLKMIDGASMFIMNCTSDPITCSQLRVIGFPTLIAFRGYGETGSEHCVTQGQVTQLIRMDFHGMLEEKSIMEWFSEISLPAVKQLPDIKEFRQSTYQKDDVILLATMYPLSLAGQYLPTLASTASWYPLECYRVACERLYGQASCLAAVSENLVGKDVERSRKEKEMIVTQVEMFRRDGIKSLIFSLGRNLMVTLQDESDSQIHAFHSPHRYKLREGQRCEDDPASCTDLIVEFVQDHGRLPVMHLTMSGFHTHSGSKFGEHLENSIFEHDLPVMIALANKGHLKEGAQFVDALTAAAYEFYNQMVFVSLNTDEFPKWASSFVPHGYRQKILEYSSSITPDFIPSLNVYPRLCIVRQDDHRHAAMFPPADRFTLAPANSPRVITKAEIARFARDFLRNGDTMVLQTEQF